MPFRQLKSFFKILIGVQYHCIAIHPGMPAEYPQKRQLFRQTAAFTWVRVRCYFRCGRQDSSTLWSTRRKRRVATVHRTAAFTWVRVHCYFRCGRQDSIILRSTRRKRRVLHSPPDCCIYMGSSLPLFPVRATGLDYTMEHPASSRRVATVHRTVAFTWVRVHRPDTKKESPRGGSLFWCGRQDSNLHG